MHHATVDELTGQPQSEREARAARDFRHFLESLPAAAYTCDTEGRLTYFNDRARELWGRAPALNSSEDRYCGSPRLYMLDGTPIPHDGCWTALALRTGKEYKSREILIERDDGTRRAALANASPLRDRKGRVVGAVNILIDISDRRRTEEALRASQAERDSQLSDLTRLNIENARLYAEIKEQHRRKDEFLAVLAHELRNPLAPIQNAARVLQAPQVEDAHRLWAAGTVDRQVRHMARLVDDLIDLQRITNGKLELRKAPIEVSDIVYAAVEASRPLIDSRGQVLQLELSRAPIYLDGDLTRLAQVVADLLDNAAKFTPHGGTITVRTERVRAEATIRVADTGIGIAPDQLTTIFQMFAQPQPAPDYANGGLGVGLTLAKRLVELHGGAIQAASAGINRGSEFTVCLPAREQAPAPARRRQTAPAPSGLRIVIVDDNRDSANSLAMLLRLMGNDVRTGHDGREAVALAEAFRPDAVLLDLGLPVISGFEAARQIRERTDATGCMLVAITGWGQASDRERSREAGFDHHLVKPVDVPRLLEILAAARPAAPEVHPPGPLHRHPREAARKSGRGQRRTAPPKSRHRSARELS